MEDNNRRYAMYLDQQFRSRNLARGNNIKVISCQIDVSRNYIVLFSVYGHRSSLSTLKRRIKIFGLPEQSVVTW